MHNSLFSNEFRLTSSFEAINTLSPFFQIIEITGLTSDAALVALHDCDNDTDRAAIMLLEGNQDVEVDVVYQPSVLMIQMPFLKSTLY